MKQIALRLPDELAALIDKAAGDIPRERWIRRTLETALAPLSTQTGAFEARLSGQGPGDTPTATTPRGSGSVKETAPTEHSVSLRAHPLHHIEGVDAVIDTVQDWQTEHADKAVTPTSNALRG